MQEQEQLITLTQAAKLAAGRPSTNCVWRWCRKGVLSRKGERIRLQHVRVGGKIFTAAVWLGEFGQRVAAADAEYFDNAQPPSPVVRPRRRRRPPTRYEQQRQEHIDRVRRELDAAGIEVTHGAAMKHKPDNGNRDKEPLVRLGQGDTQRDLYPWDFEDPPHRNEGGSVALIVLIFVFVLGMVIGGCLW